MMTHEVRVQTIVATLRSLVGKTDSEGRGWNTVKLAGIGEVSCHVISRKFAEENRFNEVWARPVTSPNARSIEFRGSAENVAADLCKLVRASAKKVEAAATLLATKKLDGLREPEMAAMFGVEEDTVFRAVELLETRGLVVNKGETGWFTRA